MMFVLFCLLCVCFVVVRACFLMDVHAHHKIEFCILIFVNVLTDAQLCTRTRNHVSAILGPKRRRRRMMPAPNSASASASASAVAAEPHPQSRQKSQVRLSLQRSIGKHIDCLHECYSEPYADVRYMLLSHNHMMNVARAFLTKAQWDSPTIEEHDKTK